MRKTQARRLCYFGRRQRSPFSFRRLDEETLMRPISSEKAIFFEREERISPGLSHRTELCATVAGLRQACWLLATAVPHNITSFFWRSPGKSVYYNHWNSRFFAKIFIR